MSTQTTFRIPDMSCASCVGRVERALLQEPGVASASASLAEGLVRVEHDAPATPGDLAARLRKAGYPPAEADADLIVEGMTCASCVHRVERAILRAEGAISAEVNLATRSARVRYAAGVTSPTELAAVVTAAGYAARPAEGSAPARGSDIHAYEAARLRRAVIAATCLSAPVVALAMGGHAIPAIHHAVMGTIGETGSNLLQMLLTAIVLLGPGRVFLSRGLPALFRGAPEMNALVAMGSLAAFGYSAAVTVAPEIFPAQARGVYFEAAASIVTLILLGRWLEARAKGRAGQAIRRLVALTPDRAEVRRPGGIVTLPLSEVVAGDVVLAAPGARIAADGVVTEGRGFVDESMLTGEPMPVAKAPGDRITGGTVNGNAALAFRVTAVGADTALARITRLVADAQAAKLPVQALVDRITMWFVPAVIAVAAVAFAAWWAFGPEPALTHALVAGISVLVIACPCAMGLATPMSILVGTGRGAELGLLFRRGDALQRLSEARIVAFDKTGTLTEGRPAVSRIVTAPGEDGTAALRLAAAAEALSDHPLARAIVAAAETRGIRLPDASGAEAEPGRGATARVEGREVRVGSPRAMEEAGISTASFGAAMADSAAAAETPVIVAVDGRAVLFIGVSDPIRPTAGAAVAALHSAGRQTAMISGDARAPAEAVGRAVGIDRVVAEVLPEGKVAAIGALRSGGAVAFVGDGINDAPALAAADVGIAIGAGTDVAIESAEVVLASGDPRAVADAIRLSEATMANIRQNLFWAFAYNAALIPVAAGALYPLTGAMLSPMLAAAAMALSSVFVVTNALRLRRAVPQAAAATPSGTFAPVMKATASDMV